MPKKLPSFSKKLITWYLENKRALPWRETEEPYPIWLSEVILQQTRVAQGIPYYLKFLEAFPTVQALAQAPQAEVLKLWQGLGYYSRARNLHAAAKIVAFERKGEFPQTYGELLELKGVGDYTASAIASICYGEPTAVVDGNVYRVLSRIFGIDTPINSIEGAKQFKELAQTLLDKSQPGTYNQAIMEFGARYCVPQTPDCNGCQFKEDCKAYQWDAVAALPVKLKKTMIRKRYFNYIVIVSNDDKTVLEQRTGNGIWRQLYEFPLVETKSGVGLRGLRDNDLFKEYKERFAIQKVILYNEEPIVHKLSHQHLHTRFWIAETEALGNNGIPFGEVQRFPVPVLIENFIGQFSVFSP
jgi:A/G-specific adenine glycosylase